MSGFGSDTKPRQLPTHKKTPVGRTAAAQQAAELEERRADELEQDRAAMGGEMRGSAEREGQLKSECARLEEQTQGLIESLSQAQALLAKEVADRTAAQQQAGELAELWWALERELAASRKQKEDLQAQLTNGGSRQGRAGAGPNGR